MSKKNGSLRPSPTIVVANDPKDRTGKLKNIGGSQSDHWNNVLVNQATQALWLGNSSAEERAHQFSATVAALVGIAPKDELEGMVAAQLVAAHNAAMECYRRAMLPEQTFEGRQQNLAQANKLSRTYASLLEAFNRHRGKGQQKVTVEHVHVHAGARAILGLATAPVGQGEGGGTNKQEEQSHAKQISHAPQSPVPSSNTQGQSLPVAGDEEWSLPNARRHGSRGR